MATTANQLPPTRGHRTQCSGCGSKMAKAHRVFRDLAFCATCYPKEFLRRPCIKCGKPARLHRSQDSGLCRSCIRSNWHCLRCKRPVTRAALLVDDKPVCKSCRRYFPPFPSKPKQEGLQTCSICRKYRKPANKTGKPVCSRCTKGGRTIEEIAQEEKAYWASRVARQLDSIAENLKTSWCHKLYLEFVEHEIDRTDPKALALKLKRYLYPFQVLEHKLPEKDAINPSSLLELFTAEDMRLHETVFRFLQKIGLAVPNIQQRCDDSEWRRIREILSSLDNPDHSVLLDRFFMARYGEGSNVAPKTIRLALNAARGLLSRASTPIPVQHDINSYLRRVPGQRAALSSFIGFLKSCGSHVSLVPSQPKKVPRRNNGQLAVCIAMLKQTDDLAQLRAAVAGALLGLLGVPLSEIVRLPRSSLEIVDNQCLLTLTDENILLDQRLYDGFKRYLDKQSQAGFSEFLFPGRDPHRPISDAAITYHFSQWGVSSRKLATDSRRFIRQEAAKALSRLSLV